MLQSTDLKALVRSKSVQCVKLLLNLFLIRPSEIYKIASIVERFSYCLLPKMSNILKKQNLEETHNEDSRLLNIYLKAKHIGFLC